MYGKHKHYFAQLHCTFYLDFTMYYPLLDVSFHGYSLILPSVSVGNVGQLSADLLISTLQCKKVGILWHRGILPIVGTDPYTVSSNSLALGAEVYICEEHKVVILQLRSSLAKVHTSEFLHELVKWIKENNFIQIVILAGSSNEERIDEQIVSEPFRYLANSLCKETHGSTFSALGWKELEERHRFPALARMGSDIAAPSEGKCVIPGGGFARRLYSLCSEENVPCAVLIKFCSEGDNVPDALLITSKLNAWMHVVNDDLSGSIQIKFPPSWSLLFGNPPPKQLY